MKYFKISLISTIFIFSILLVNVTSAQTAPQKSNQALTQSDLNSIYTMIMDREDALSSKMLDYAAQSLQHSKDTINYFLIILSFVTVVTILFGWKTIKDVEKNARTKIEEIAKKEIKNVTLKLESKIDKVDEKASLWRQLKDQEDPKKQLEIIDELIRKDQNDYTLYGRKGIILEDMGRFEEAIEMFDKVIHINTTDPIAFFHKSNCFSSLKKFDQALGSIDAAIGLKPRSIYLNAKADIYLEMKNYAGAIDLYEQAKNLTIKEMNGKCNNYGMYLIQISFCFQKLKDYARAYDKARIGLSLGFQLELAVNKGLAAAGLNKREEAEELLNLAAETGVRNDEVVYCQARMYSLLKDYGNTLKYLKMAIDKNKKFIEDAKKEDDFDFVAKMEDFKLLVGV